MIRRRRFELAAAAVVLAVVGITVAVAWPSRPAYHPRSLPIAAPSVTPHAAVSPGAATAVPRISPISVIIPSIGVNATVEPVYDPGGVLQTPPLAEENIVGWWAGVCGSQDTGPCPVTADPQGSYAPGQDGPAVIVGHVNSAASGNLVFANLDKMVAGESIEIEPGNLWFTVTATQEVSKTEFPTAAVYGPTSGPTLRLITCGGAFDAATGHYEDNFIVYADAAAPGGH